MLDGQINISFLQHLVQPVYGCVVHQEKSIAISIEWHIIPFHHGQQIQIIGILQFLCQTFHPIIMK